MPAEGGTPKRLTHTATLSRDDVSDRMGPNNIVLDWTPDGKYIIFRSRMFSFNSFVGQLFKVPVDGGMAKQLELPRGSWCSINEDGSQMIYNRVFREFRTWKYYRGGMADDLWLHSFTTHETTRLFKNPAQDIFPMWHGDKVYFLSDRDRIINLFSFDLNTKETKKITNFETYDIKFPSLGKDKISFENGGYIYLYDLNNKSLKKLDIQISEDLARSRKQYIDASDNIRYVNLAPDAKRLLVGARGEIFTVPANNGITHRITRSNGAHDRAAVWSPDGRYIAYLSDKSGEYAIYLHNNTKTTADTKLSEDFDTYPYSLKWSPDSKKLMWSDKKLQLQYMDIEEKETHLVKKSDIWEIRSYDWAPDSKWIAFTDSDSTRITRIHMYSLENKRTHTITSKWFDSSSPHFSHDGKYLFFTSNRDFNPTYSDTEWNHAYRDMTGIYYLCLNKEVPDLLAAQNDTVAINKKTKDNKKTETNKEKTVSCQVDFNNIKQRLGKLPIKASNYGNLNYIDGRLYYNERALKHSLTLKMYDFKKREEKELTKKAGFEISADRKKMLLSKSGKYYIVAIPKSEIKLKDAVKMEGMKIWVDRHKEWQQIYDEAWRQMRDFFYDPGMHGVDWNAMHDKYKPLVAHVNHRNDLNYIIGELIGELNVGHAYISGGDRETPERIYTGMLGAELSHNENGYFKIEQILEGRNWYDEYRSPLTAIGLNVKEGEFITAANGQDLSNVKNINALLSGQAGKKVILSISKKPSGKDTRDVIIKPVKDVSKLYYHKWVQGNIESVNEATDGRVGYIHIPNMVIEGLNEFVKYFYPQLHKEALIIDDRGNGGGNVSPMIIERLRRELSLMGMARNVSIPDKQPGAMVKGPKVLLVNQYSASDGDLFPYQFRKHKLGTIIGQRTWGGVVGIRGSLPFIDGGSMRKPEFAHFAADGSDWIIEGHGVEPDIEIINDPYKEFSGTDAQLNKAIEVILKQLENADTKIPEIPEFPDKSK